MQSLTKSLVGFRAFLVLALSVLCFFAFQYAPVHGIDGRITAAAPASVDVAHLAKRVGVPFGDSSIADISSTATTSQTNHSDLVKRAEPEKWTLKYDDAVCRGRQLAKQIMDARSDQDARTWTYKQLTGNQGWNTPKEKMPTIPVGLREGFAARGMAIADFKYREARFERGFTNDAGEEKPSGFGWYEQAYAAKKGSILAISNISPGYCVNYNVPRDDPNRIPTATVKTMIPPLNTLGDVTWTMWVDTAGETNAKNLRYIWQDNAINMNTKHIIEHVFGLKDKADKTTHDDLQKRWPGKTWSIDAEDEQAFALLGTPQGGATAFILMDHKHTLGVRSLYITAWTQLDQEREQYFLLFDMRRSPT